MCQQSRRKRKRGQRRSKAATSERVLEEARELGVAVRHVGGLLRERVHHVAEHAERQVDLLAFLRAEVRRACPRGCTRAPARRNRARGREVRRTQEKTRGEREDEMLLRTCPSE